MSGGNAPLRRGEGYDVLVDACVRQAAMQAAERGWYVFPTRPGGKEPRKGMSWPEAATCDVGPVGDRANWRPGENYGVAAKRSGLVILDLDQPKPGYVLPAAWQDEPGIVDGADVLAALAERAAQPWPCTFHVRTPSGGHHLYYRAIPGRQIGNRPAGPMIDVRGGGESNGGYVIGPGSILDGRKYEVADDQEPQQLPGWIADLLDPPAEPRAGRSRCTQILPQGDLYGRMRGIVDRLANAGPGDGRNSLLHWSACRFAEMVADGEIDRPSAENALYLAADANGHVAKHGERATRATIASGMRRAVAA